VSSFWTGRKVVVTGAGGFIGSHLVERLAADGAEVTAFVRYTSLNGAGFLDGASAAQPIRVRSGDITDLETVRSVVKGSDTVFHLAALVGIPYSYVHPTEVVEVNTNGTLNVLIAARDADVRRVVVTSTSEVYGSALVTPMAEDHPRQPQSPYSASKIAADALALSFHYSFDLGVSTVRPFNTYGPRQSDRAIIPTIAAQALSGVEEIVLGNLSPRRDLTFVSDTVEGFVAIGASERTVGVDVNLGSGRSISIGELAERITRVVGRDVPIRQDEQRVRPDASEVQDLVADTSRARELVGWEPRVSLDDGLRRVVDWVAANSSLYDPSTYRI
jgi:NAD dependent epimerase/dehydratase